MPTVRDPAFKPAGSLRGYRASPVPNTHTHTHTIHTSSLVLPTGLSKEQALAGFVAE